MQNWGLFLKHDNKMEENLILVLYLFKSQRDVERFEFGEGYCTV